MFGTADPNCGGCGMNDPATGGCICIFEFGGRDDNLFMYWNSVLVPGKYSSDCTDDTDDGRPYE